MKKVISILLAVFMLSTIACAALAEDTVPQPEGGKKFESDWAIAGGIVNINYEEEGYRVFVSLDNLGNGTGAEWQYACYYHEETDSLVSITSIKTDYTVNPDNGDKVYVESAYEGFDEDGQETEFTIDENGFLLWKDGHENAGADLQFINIGAFEGVWRNEEEEVEAEFMWNGTSEDDFFYTVYIQRGMIGAQNYALYLLNGTFDPATGKLSAYGTCTLFTLNESGEYDATDDGESYDAFFSFLEDGRLLYETANGIELTYDIMCV